MRAKTKSISTQTARERVTMPEMAADALVRPLLISRRDAAVMLGRVDVCLIKRLEKMGVLHPMRLNPRSTSAQVFFDISEVIAVARGYMQNPQATTDDTEVEEKQPRRRRSSREARA
jgi:hypothetical protein